MNGSEISKSVYEGYKSAITLAHSFFGVELSDYSEPELRPEYLVTLSLATAFNAGYRHVRLEAPLKPIMNYRHRYDLCFDRYEMKERFDLTISEDDNESSPETFIEIKLNDVSEDLVTKDLSKLLKVLDRYREAGISGRLGIFLFHFVRRVSSDASKAETLLERIEKSSKEVLKTRLDLNLEFGFLDESVLVSDQTTIKVLWDDECEEELLGREELKFTPGILLLSYDHLPNISLSKNTKNL